MPHVYWQTPTYNYTDLELLARGLDAAGHVRALSLRDNRLAGCWADAQGRPHGAFEGRGAEALAAHLLAGAAKPGLAALDLRRSGLDARCETQKRCRTQVPQKETPKTA